MKNMCITCRLGFHVTGKLAADTVVVGADVVKTPASELLGTVELLNYKIVICYFFKTVFVHDNHCCGCLLLVWMQMPEIN